MTGEDVINRARTLLGDQRARRFTDAEMLTELNTILREVCSDLPWYKKTAGVNLKDMVSVYEFPDDLIDVVAMNLDDALYGDVILSTTYQNLLNGEQLPSNSLSSYWNFTSGRVVNEENMVYFRDTVSHNEFRVEPQVRADSGAGTAATYDSVSNYWAP